MEAVVWYASWQMECCGDPFAVGDTVTWTVEENIDDEWFEAALGPGRAAQITHAEEHHSDDGPLTDISGRVLSITGAWCAYGPSKPGDRVHYPLEGSAQFGEVRKAPGSERETLPGLTFNGWIVKVAMNAEFEAMEAEVGA